MIISLSEFIKSAKDTNNLVKDDFYQFCFVGRSNVGKSSLINYICNRKDIARTSKTPGRTRLVNYFLINKSFYFVDLPGYGFASGNKKEVSEWQSLIESYLLQNTKLLTVFVLMDIRRGATDMDKQMINFLYAYKIPFCVVATKCDKITKSNIKSQIRKMALGLGLAEGNIIPTSSEKRFGKNEVLELVENKLNIE